MLWSWWCSLLCESLCCSELAWQAALSIAGEIHAAFCMHKQLNNYMHGENNIIHCASIDATDAQPWILYIFWRGDEGKGRGREMWGGGGAVLLHVWLLEQKQSSAHRMQSERYRGQRTQAASTPFRSPTACFSASVVRKNNKIAYETISPSILSFQKTCSLKFRVRLGRFCVTSMFCENVNRNVLHLALSIVWLKPVWFFPDHTRDRPGSHFRPVNLPRDKHVCGCRSVH